MHGTGPPLSSDGSRRYEDISLAFEERRGTLWVRLEGASAEVGGAISEPALGKIRDDIESSIGGASSLRDFKESTLRDLGEKLFDVIFHGSLRQFWDQARGRIQSQGLGLRLRIALDESHPRFTEWASIPWEILYCRSLGEFLSLDRRISLVRTLPVPVPVEEAEAATHLQALVVGSSPRGEPSLDLDLEYEALCRAVGAGSELAFRAADDATETRLRHVLLDGEFQILHFIGHGYAPDASRSSFGVLLEGDLRSPVEVDAKYWAHLLAGTGLRLVALNACHTAAQRSPRGESSHGLAPALIQGVAQGLVRGGVPAVIGMDRAISAAAASKFSSTLYRRLAAGDLLEEAMVEGRRAMAGQVRQLEGGWDGEWTLPTLFLRGDGEDLFCLASTGEKDREHPTTDSPGPSIEVEELSGRAGKVIGGEQFGSAVGARVPAARIRVNRITGDESQIIGMRQLGEDPEGGS